MCSASFRAYRVGSGSRDSDIGPRNDGAGEWPYVDHLIDHQWRYLGGEGGDG